MHVYIFIYSGGVCISLVGTGPYIYVYRLRMHFASGVQCSSVHSYWLVCPHAFIYMNINSFIRCIVRSLALCILRVYYLCIVSFVWRFYNLCTVSPRQLLVSFIHNSWSHFNLLSFIYKYRVIHNLWITLLFINT